MQSEVGTVIRDHVEDRRDALEARIAVRINAAHVCEGFQQITEVVARQADGFGEDRQWLTTEIRR